MLKGYKILTSFCVICATLYGGAYGAASVRGGATSRAGSIRTLGAGTTASVKTTTSRTQPTTTAANANTESTESVGGMRMSHATGLGGSKLPGKISGTTTSTSGDNQNVAELRQAIEQLRNDYDALGEQYNNLLGDVSNVSDTAQVAHETATNNTNTLTVVRSDLSVAKSDIEDLKATGGFDEERVQEALDTTLAQRNYATRGELAATDAVARGAVQVADLPQTLNALNIADKDYVASRTQGVVNDSLNITLENYYTKKQVNDAIDVAKIGMVDKNYVDNQIDGLAPKTYVDNRVASIQTGVSEGAVQGIIDNSIDTRLGNYYTKGDIDNAIVDAIGAAKDGMADRDYVDNQVRDLASTEYVNEKVAEIESGVDAGTLYNILETRGYKTGTEVQGIVNDSINNTVANYYTKGQVDNAINVAKNGMADRNYVDNQIDGLAPKNWVNTVVDAKVNALPLGLDQNAVKAVVEGYGYKDDAAVRNILAEYNYAKADDIPNMIAELAPGADIQYDNGVLTFKDKNGNPQTVDIRGLDGQDGAQVELQKNGDKIQWRYESDTAWHDLVNVSDLRGVDGKSVELGVQTMTVGGMPIKDALVYKKDGENNWQFLYNLDNIAGADGCGIKVETNDYVSGGALLGKTVKLLRDCPASSLDGAQLTSFNVLNGADGTVTEEQIVDALESDETFKQLKTKVANLETNQSETYNLAMGVSDAVENPETGLAATNTLANKAWNKVKDLDPNVTTKDYVDSYVNGKIGNLDYDPTTYGKFASVAAKLGSIGNKTMKDYVDEKVRGVTTEINVDKGDDGFTYICKNGNACTSKPNSWDNQWERIDVDLSGYLNKETADNLYASFGTEVMARDAATAAAAAQTTANKAWGKLDDLGNKTVKSYVEDVVGVGSLGINPLTGVSYTVAGKLGFGQGAATQTVKEYIDEKFRSVNTEIMIADGPDGLMYICRKGNTCTTPAGPSNSYEWAAVSVDMSDYLKESDAEREFATITELNRVQATANEAKTAANTAQTNAAQAQNAANSAQSTANDAWDKLSDLGNTTVREFVEDKVSGLGTTIDVRTVGGTTYICKVGKCLDTPPSDWWEPITVTISDEYLTETEGNALYALKTQIGDLGGSFASVGAKIGLNSTTDSSKTVKQYVDDKFDNISTTIQIDTSNGTTYICKQGSGCPTNDFGNTYYWAPVAVNLGDLGTNPTTSKTYTVAEKIGLTGNNSSKTVFGYIGDRIGETGNSTTYPYAQRSVVEYAQDTYVPFTRLGNEIGSSQTVAQYITQRIGDTGTVNDYYSGQSRPKSVVEFLAGSYVPLTTIGNLGSASYGGQSYTVEGKIGLNSTTDSSKTVKQYVDGLIGTSLLGSYSNVIAYGNENYALKSDFNSLSTTVSGHTNLLSGLGDGMTVKQYVDSKAPNIQIAPGSNGTMWYCTRSTPCDTNNVGNSYYGWASFNISDSLNLTSYLKTSDAASTYLTIANATSNYYTKTDADGRFAAKSVQDAVNDETTGLGATRALASSASAAAATADTKAGNAATAAETAQGTANNAWNKVKGLDDVSGLSDKTVAGYVDYRLGNIPGSQTVAEYISENTPKFQMEKVGTQWYICKSGNCTGTPPSGTGWEEFDMNVDLSDYYTKTESDGKFALKTTIGNLGMYYDTEFGGNQPYSVEKKLDVGANQTVKQYVDNAISGLSDTYAAKSTETVASAAQSAAEGAQSTANNANTTANNAWAKVSGLNDISGLTDKTVTGYLAYRLGDIPSDQTVKAYIAANTPRFQMEKVGTQWYICKSGNCTGTPLSGTGWEEFDMNVDLSDYYTKTESDGKFALKTTIGNLGMYYDTEFGGNQPYSVEKKLDIGANQTVKQYVDSNIGALGGSFTSVGAKIGLTGDDASQTVKSYVDAVDNRIGSLGKINASTDASSVADKLGTAITGANKTVAKYIEDYVTQNGGVQVQTVSGTTYICSENCDGAGTPPCADGTYPSTCGWQKLEVNLNGYATEQYVDGAIGTLGGNYTNVGDKINISSGTVKSYVDAVDNRIGSLGSREVDGEQKPYTVEAKIGDIPAAQTIKDYIDNNMPNIDVRPGTADADKNKLYICTKPNCDTENIPGAIDSGWVELDIASAINLSLYLTKTDAASTYLRQEGIKLKRDGKDIKIWGGGIAESEAYKVADIEDLMCASYRMEEIGSDDPAYQDGKKSFRLVCETVSEDNNN